MVDHSTRQILVDAPPEICFDVASDFENYPEWVPDVKKVQVRVRNDQGLGRLISFQVAAMGRSTTYVLDYRYETDPLKMTWRLLEGDLANRLDGEYKFVPAPGEKNRTLLTYTLTVDLAVPVPGFVKRRAEARILHSALDGFRRRVELCQREIEEVRNSNLRQVD